MGVVDCFDERNRLLAELVPPLDSWTAGARVLTLEVIRMSENYRISYVYGTIQKSLVLDAKMRHPHAGQFLEVHNLPVGFRSDILSESYKAPDSGIPKPWRW